MPMLPKCCQPDKFESDNSLQIFEIFIQILYIVIFFLEPNSSDTLALCETNLDDSIDSDNSSLRGYLPLIWKDFTTHMHDLAVYVKEELSFTWYLSWENSVVSYICFRLPLLFLLLPLLKQAIDSHQFKPTDVFTDNHDTNATKIQSNFNHRWHDLL